MSSFFKVACGKIFTQDIYTKKEVWKRKYIILYSMNSVYLNFNKVFSFGLVSGMYSISKIKHSSLFQQQARVLNRFQLPCKRRSLDISCLFQLVETFVVIIDILQCAWCGPWMVIATNKHISKQTKQQTLSLSVCQSVSESVSQSICVSVCLSVCLSVSQLASQSASQSVRSWWMMDDHNLFTNYWAFVWIHSCRIIWKGVVIFNY